MSLTLSMFKYIYISYFPSTIHYKKKIVFAVFLSFLLMIRFNLLSNLKDVVTKDILCTLLYFCCTRSTSLNRPVFKWCISLTEPFLLGLWASVELTMRSMVHSKKSIFFYSRIFVSWLKLSISVVMSPLKRNWFCGSTKWS